MKLAINVLCEISYTYLTCFTTHILDLNLSVEAKTVKRYIVY